MKNMNSQMRFWGLMVLSVLISSACVHGRRPLVHRHIRHHEVKTVHVVHHHDHRRGHVCPRCAPPRRVERHIDVPPPAPHKHAPHNCGHCAGRPRYHPAPPPPHHHHPLPPGRPLPPPPPPRHDPYKPRDQHTHPRQDWPNSPQKPDQDHSGENSESNEHSNQPEENSPDERDSDVKIEPNIPKPQFEPKDKDQEEDRNDDRDDEAEIQDKPKSSSSSGGQPPVLHDSKPRLNSQQGLSSTQDRRASPARKVLRKKTLSPRQ